MYPTFPYSAYFSPIDKSTCHSVLCLLSCAHWAVPLFLIGKAAVKNVQYCHFYYPTHKHVVVQVHFATVPPYSSTHTSSQRNVSVFRPPLSTGCEPGNQTPRSNTNLETPTVSKPVHRCPCQHPGTSSGNWQQTGTLVVRACHAPRQPSTPFFRAHWRVSDAVVGRGNCWMDNIKEWTSLAHARTAHDGLPQERLEEDLCWIVPHVPPDDANRSRD